jgi:ABC-type sulfate/molybdate transport systems ATPase subunit
MLASAKAVYFIDEPSTGLDASATFDITLMILTFTRALRTTVLMSLLQPPPEVFELFDRIVMLDQGEIVYQVSMCSDAVSRHMLRFLIYFFPFFVAYFERELEPCSMIVVAAGSQGGGPLLLGQARLPQAGFCGHRGLSARSHHAYVPAHFFID